MCVADVFYPLLQHADTQDSDEENLSFPVPDPVGQTQQRIGDVTKPHIQLTETQLDKLLKLNDMFNAGILGNSNEKDLEFMRNIGENEMADTYLQPASTASGSIYQPDLSSLVAGSDSRSLPHGGLDYSDFGRSATGDLLTDHTDYALLDSSHSPDWEMYGSLTDKTTQMDNTRK